MNAEGIWRLFCETGNLNCYLAYKELQKARDRERDRDRIPETELYEKQQTKVNM